MVHWSRIILCRAVQLPKWLIYDHHRMAGSRRNSFSLNRQSARCEISLITEKSPPYTTENSSIKSWPPKSCSQSSCSLGMTASCEVFPKSLSSVYRLTITSIALELSISCCSVFRRQSPRSFGSEGGASIARTRA